MSESLGTSHTITTSIPAGTYTAIKALTNRTNAYTTTYTAAENLRQNIAYACLNDTAVFAHDQTGQLAGIITYKQTPDDDTTIELTTVIIAPEKQRSGVLQSLLTQIIESVSQRYTEFALTCSSANDQLIRAIRSVGFNKSGTVTTEGPAESYRYTCRFDTPLLST